MSESNLKSDYIRGLKDGIPVGLGYLPVSMACGIAASKAGISFFVSQLMSMFIYSGSGQATATNLFSGGETSILMYALALFVMNCRYMLFAISLSQRLEPSITLKEKILIGVLNTDEIFGIVSKEKGNISGKYFLGVATMPYICYFLGNVVGSFATNVLPESVNSVMGMMLYSMLIALIIPSARKSKKVLMIILIALLVSGILECIPFITAHLTSGWIVILCAVITSLVGALLLPVSENGEEEF